MASGPPRSCVNTGPLLPFARLAIAAAQLHQTGHSSIVQHFRRVKVGSADGAAIRLSIRRQKYLPLLLSFLEASQQGQHLRNLVRREDAR